LKNFIRTRLADVLSLTDKGNLILTTLTTNGSTDHVEVTEDDIIKFISDTLSKQPDIDIVSLATRLKNELGQVKNPKLLKEKKLKHWLERREQFEVFSRDGLHRVRIYSMDRPQPEPVKQEEAEEDQSELIIDNQFKMPEDFNSFDDAENTAKQQQQDNEKVYNTVDDGEEEYKFEDELEIKSQNEDDGYTVEEIDEENGDEEEEDKTEEEEEENIQYDEESSIDTIPANEESIISGIMQVDDENQQVLDEFEHDYFAEYGPQVLNDRIHFHLSRLGAKLPKQTSSMPRTYQSPGGDYLIPRPIQYYLEISWPQGARYQSSKYEIYEIDWCVFMLQEKEWNAQPFLRDNEDAILIGDGECMLALKLNSSYIPETRDMYVYIIEDTTDGTSSMDVVLLSDILASMERQTDVSYE
jgi:hypothetical protein